MVKSRNIFAGVELHALGSAINNEPCPCLGASMIESPKGTLPMVGDS